MSHELGVNDPFEQLGLDRDATPADVRAARRDLARRHHPDAGGDSEVMRRLNVAAADALKILADPSESQAVRSTESDASRGSGAAPSGSQAVRSDEPDREPAVRDAPSFTVEALPVETFEALLVASAELGEVEDDDPPYLLTALLGAPIECWCQLDIVPDAGASTVSVAIAPADDRPLPPLLAVRNAWIDALNGLDWSSL